jgi:uncharacterized protein (DUF2267 family)
MSATRFGGFDHATRTAHGWLDQIATAFDTGDRHYVYRAVRAWLHTLRDRLGVDSAADFAAQLPELWRGVFYDGWQPAKVPIKYHADEYQQRFAHEAAIPTTDVPTVARTVTAALRHLLAPGQLDHAMAQLPRHLRALIDAPATQSPQPATSQPREPTGWPQETAGEPVDERLGRIEARLDTLTEALRVLAAGLERRPYDEPGTNHRAQAARRAHELLLAMPGAVAGDAAS